MWRSNPGEACFYCIFRDLRRFYLLDIQKLKYAAAYVAYTQARPWVPFFRFVANLWCHVSGISEGQLDMPGIILIVFKLNKNFKGK